MSNPVIRYSDEELAVFKELIEKKISKSQEQLNGLMAQILEANENSSNEYGGDWVDNSSINSEMEMLNNMAVRQRIYLQELENALIRIRNKSYGICVISGELIDKKRLMAVPTTTKSLAAKTGIPITPARPKPSPRAGRSAANSGGKPKVISKVIRKSSNNLKPPVEEEEEEIEELDFDLYTEEEEDSLTENDSGMEEMSDEEMDY